MLYLPSTLAIDDDMAYFKGESLFVACRAQYGEQVGKMGSKKPTQHAIQKWNGEEGCKESKKKKKAVTGEGMGRRIHQANRGGAL